jgi:hypothetical protein
MMMILLLMMTMMMIIFFCIDIFAIKLHKLLLIINI